MKHVYEAYLRVTFAGGSRSPIMFDKELFWRSLKISNKVLSESNYKCIYIEILNWSSTVII